MKRIEIVLTHSVYRRVAELAAASDLKVTEVARLGLRRIPDLAGALQLGGRTIGETLPRAEE